MGDRTSGSGFADGDWFRFLSRWSLAGGLVTLALLATFVALFATTGDLPEDNAELEIALEHRAFFRLAIVLDMAAWILLGGFTLALGALVLRRGAAVRGLLTLAGGFAAAVGLAGAVLRYSGTLELADRYEDAGAEARESVLTQHVDLSSVVSALFDAGSLLGNAGWVLAASALLALPGFPRWLAWFLGVVGGLGVVNFFLFVGTGEAVLFLIAFPLTIVLLFATAVRLWRTS